MQKKITQSTVGMRREGGAKYVASYGGGVNSTAMIIHLAGNRFPLDCVVFSDTGDEMPETYEYLDVMAKYLKRRNIPLEIVMNRKKEPLSEKCLRRGVIPSQVWRWCTRDFKVTPIHAFYRKLQSHVYQYMGIDYGEVHRMKPSGADYVTNLYPLIDYKINREGCINIIKGARLPVPIKSGCYFCPYNNMARWEGIYEKHPDLFRRARKIEESNKHYGTQRLALRGYSLKEIDKMLKKKKKLPVIEVGSPCGSECMV